MPEKLKKSIKHFNRKTGKTTIEHLYLHATKLNELLEIINSDKASAKLKIKCKRELDRRTKNG